MLTSAKIRTEPDDFAPFLIHPELGEMMDPKTFCETNVDPTGKEAGEWALVWLLFGRHNALRWGRIASCLCSSEAETRVAHEA